MLFLCYVSKCWESFNHHWCCILYITIMCVSKRRTLVVIVLKGRLLIQFLNYVYNLQLPPFIFMWTQEIAFLSSRRRIFPLLNRFWTPYYIMIWGRAQDSVLYRLSFSMRFYQSYHISLLTASSTFRDRVPGKHPERTTYYGQRRILLPTSSPGLEPWSPTPSTQKTSWVHIPSKYPSIVNSPPNN